MEQQDFIEFESEELNKFSQYVQRFSEDKREIFRILVRSCLPSNYDGVSNAAIDVLSFETQGSKLVRLK